MQLIEGRLGEDYEPRNVQVDLMEVAPGAFAIKLRSADGVIAEIPAEDSRSDGDADGGEDREPEEEEEGGGAREDALPSRERELTARVADAEAELEFVRDRASKLETELEQMQKNSTAPEITDESIKRPSER
jgi:hypothetical protein